MKIKKEIWACVIYSICFLSLIFLLEVLSLPLQVLALWKRIILSLGAIILILFVPAIIVDWLFKIRNVNEVEGKQ